MLHSILQEVIPERSHICKTASDSRTYADVSGVLSLTHLPLEVLRAELSRRQDGANGKPECGSAGSGDTYNTPLHVTALVLILILSTLGMYRSKDGQLSQLTEDLKLARSQSRSNASLDFQYRIASYSSLDTLGPGFS